MNEFYENGILVTQVRALTNYNYVLIKSNQIKSDQIRSNQIKSDQIRLNQIKSKSSSVLQKMDPNLAHEYFFQFYKFLLPKTNFKNVPL